MLKGILDRCYSFMLQHRLALRPIFFLLFSLIGPLIRAWLHFVGKTIRINSLYLAQVQREEEQGRNFIFVFQHLHLTDMLACLIGRIHLRKPLCVFTRSPWVRGLLADSRRFNVILYLGSRRRHILDLMRRIQEASRRGEHIIISIDDFNPHTATRGVFDMAVRIAVAAGCPIIPVCAASRHSIRLAKTWMPWTTPLPGTRMHLEFGEQVTIDLAGIRSEKRHHIAEQLDMNLTRLASDCEHRSRDDSFVIKRDTRRAMLLAFAAFLLCLSAMNISFGWTVLPIAGATIVCFLLLGSWETFHVPGLVVVDLGLDAQLARFREFVDFACKAPEEYREVKIVMGRLNPRLMSSSRLARLRDVLRQAVDCNVHLQILFGEAHQNYTLHDIPDDETRQWIRDRKIFVYFNNGNGSIRPHFLVACRSHVILERTHEWLADNPEFPARYAEVRYFSTTLAHAYSENFSRYILRPGIRSMAEEAR